MKQEHVRNPRYNAAGGVDCDIKHKALGWIPFTASPDDVEPKGRLVFELAAAGAYGEITPYTAPPEPEYSDQDIRVMRRQAYIQEPDPLKAEAEYDALVNNSDPDYTAWMAKVGEIKNRFPLRSSTNG